MQKPLIHAHAKSHLGALRLLKLSARNAIAGRRLPGERLSMSEGRESRQALSFRKMDGGAGGIRTLDTAFQPYNGLANRRLQPLGHRSVPDPSRSG